MTSTDDLPQPGCPDAPGYGPALGRLAATRVWPWGLFVLLPLLLLAPASTLGDLDPAWPGWLALVVVAASFSMAVVASQNRRLRRTLLPEVMLALLTATVAVATVTLAPEWGTLSTLLGLAAGATVRMRWAAAVVASMAVGATTLLVVAGSTLSDAIWSTGITTLLAGVATLGFRRLIGAVLALDRSRQELAEAAVVAERLRFSRDLHDLLGHTLSVIVVKAEAVRRLGANDPEAAATHAADIETIGRRALVEIREAVEGYRPSAFAQELGRARSALAAAGISSDVSGAGAWQGSPAGEADAVLGWVLREAVTNVVRHSGARRCVIEVELTDDVVRLRVDDDGRGGAQAAERSTRGLRGMRERVDAAGGRLSFADLAPGLRVTVELPVRTRSIVEVRR